MRSLLGVLVSWELEANYRMIVGASQMHRRHSTLIFLPEKRVDRFEEDGFNPCGRVGQIGIHAQSSGDVHAFIE